MYQIEKRVINPVTGQTEIILSDASDLQEKIFSFAQTLENHLLIKATAGSGKTTVLKEIVKILLNTRKGIKIGMFAFNKDIVKELIAVLDHLTQQYPNQLDISTFHSFGCKAIMKARRVSTQNQNYVSQKIYKLTEQDYDSARTKEERKAVINLRSILNKSVSLAKATLINYEDINEVEKMCDTYGIELFNGDRERVINTLPQLMKFSQESYFINFDDMLYRPVFERVNVQQYDVVLVDEKQDMNTVQNELAGMALKPNTGKLFAVGDDSQSIYAFRGADTESMNHFVDKFKATILPLSITYRCPKSHVDYVRQVIPDSTIEASPTAKEGILETVEEKRFLNDASTTDLVLCRKNAPLASYAFKFIGLGKKATVKGKEIGQSLVTLIEKQKADDLEQLFIKLNEFKQRETMKYVANKQEHKLDLLNDKLETIDIISERCKTIEDLIREIESLFSDDIKGITLSTVHKAKGLEANTVWILELENMPLPFVLKRGIAKEIQQEMNCKFVALTRSKNAMYFVTTPESRKQRQGKLNFQQEQ